MVVYFVNLSYSPCPAIWSLFTSPISMLSVISCIPALYSMFIVEICPLLDLSVRVLNSKLFPFYMSANVHLCFVLDII